MRTTQMSTLGALIGSWAVVLATFGGGCGPGELRTGDELDKQGEPAVHHAPPEAPPAQSGNHTPGTLAGDFSVTNQGAASYSVPIMVPPGTAGMQPRLSLQYSSQRGNGLVGIGWALGGLSAITRCPKTYAQDSGQPAPVDFSATDRFCLDGQRLVAISGSYGADGTQYRTERESFARITSVGKAANGPGSFEVYTKDGRILYYGSGPKAGVTGRLLRPGQKGVMTWALAEIRDRSDNYMTVSYQGSMGANAASFRPVRIDYTGHGRRNLKPYASVTFVYAETRPDPQLEYGAGALFRVTRRLTDIQTHLEGKLVQNYHLEYETSPTTSRSRLVSMKRCGANLCLPATSFEWTPGAKGWDAAAKTEHSVKNMKYAHLIDVNGDGRSDLVYPDGTWHVLVSSGRSFNAAIDTNVSTTSYKKAQPIDYDSDGAVDLIMARNGTLRVLRWKTGASNTFAIIKTGIRLGEHDEFGAGDFNGDGRTDIVVDRRKATGSSFGLPIRFRYQDGTKVYLQNPTGGFAGAQVKDITHPTGTTKIYGEKVKFDVYGNAPEWVSALSVQDLDGDGKAEVLLTYYAADIVYAVDDGDLKVDDDNSDLITVAASLVGSSFRKTQYWKLSMRLEGCADYCSSDDIKTFTARPQGVDLNGDGLRDVVTNQRGRWSRSLSNGTRNLQSWSSTGVAALGGGKNWPVAVPTDYDGDGRTDLLERAGNKTAWRLLRSTGTGLQVKPFSLTAKHIAVGDVDGDGLSDLVSTPADNGAVSIHLHKGLVPDKMDGVQDGLGKRIEITYLPGTNSDIHSSTEQYVFPHRRLVAPMPLVATVLTSNGLAAKRTHTYVYDDLALNVQGRGVVGFSKVVAADKGSHTATETSYRQDYPFVGMVADVTSYHTGTGKWIAVQRTSHELEVLGCSADCASRPIALPYVQKSTVQRYEADGSLVSTTVSETEIIDAYGNPETVTTRTTAGGQTHSQTTVNTITNDVSRWLLGQVTRTEVTSRAYGKVLTHTTGFGYDPERGFLTSKIVEPGAGGNLELTTTYGLDGFGNTTSVWEFGHKVDRTSTSIYDLRGRFVDDQMNAEKHKTSFKYDGRFGAVTTLTDANSLMSETTYDSLGRIKFETRPDKTTTEYKYEGGSKERATAYSVKAEPSNGPVTWTEYDELMRERYSIQLVKSAAAPADYQWSATEYDEAGRKRRVSNPAISKVGDGGRWTQYKYDELGRVTKTTRPDATTVRTEYDGLTTTVFDGRGLPTRKEGDASGRVRQITDADNSTLTYTYDPAGNVRTITDPDNNILTMRYDLRGRKVFVDDPDTGSWYYDYNAASELTWQRDPHLLETEMVYDNLGRMTQRTEQEGVSTWTYDTAVKAVGKLVGTTGAVGNYVKTTIYDELSRPSATTTNFRGATYRMGYRYDADGRLERLTYPEGFSVTQGYDDTGRLTTLTDNHGKVHWELQDLDDAGRPLQEKLGNALVTTRGYDPRGRPESIVTRKASGPPVQLLDYTYDDAGNLKYRGSGPAGNSVNETFGYDRLNRLTTVTPGHDSSATPLTVHYDALGNIEYKSDVGDYLYQSSRPHAVTMAAGEPYGYDEAGQMVSGAGRTIAYSSFGKPVHIDGGGGQSMWVPLGDDLMFFPVGTSDIQTFAYGPDHELVERADGDRTTVFVGGLYERVQKGSAAEHRYQIQAGGRTVATHTVEGSVHKTHYLHHDHLGSVQTITDQAGQLVEGGELSYDPFGKRRHADGSLASFPGDLSTSHLVDQGYTGHLQLDGSGLVHMAGRIYDPHLGRFISADPVLPNLEDLQSFNRYSYVNNNPLRYTDPTGHDPFDVTVADVSPSSARSSGASAYMGDMFSGVTTSEFSGMLGGVYRYVAPSRSEPLRTVWLGTSSETSGSSSAGTGSGRRLETISAPKPLHQRDVIKDWLYTWYYTRSAEAKFMDLVGLATSLYGGVGQPIRYGADAVTRSLMKTYRLNQFSRLYRTTNPKFLDRPTRRALANRRSVGSIRDHYNPEQLYGPELPHIVGPKFHQTACRAFSEPSLNVAVKPPVNYATPDRVMISMRLRDVLRQGGRIYPDDGAMAQGLRPLIVTIPKGTIRYTLVGP